MLSRQADQHRHASGGIRRCCQLPTMPCVVLFAGLSTKIHRKLHLLYIYCTSLSFLVSQNTAHRGGWAETDANWTRAHGVALRAGSTMKRQGRTRWQQSTQPPGTRAAEPRESAHALWTAPNSAVLYHVTHANTPAHVCTRMLAVHPKGLGPERGAG